MDEERREKGKGRVGKKRKEGRSEKGDGENGKEKVPVIRPPDTQRAHTPRHSTCALSI